MFKDADVGSHKNKNAQTRKEDNYQKQKDINAKKEELVRLHVQLRKDLELKILSLIYHTKIDPAKKEKLTKKEKVTKRTIVEEALEEYFDKRGI